MIPTDDNILSFARGYRLQHDRVRDIWLIQAPEKVFVVEGSAPDILRLVNNRNTTAAIISQLTCQFDADPEIIGNDVRLLLSKLIEKGALQA